MFKYLIDSRHDSFLLLLIVVPAFHTGLFIFDSFQGRQIPVFNAQCAHIDASGDCIIDNRSFITPTIAQQILPIITVFDKIIIRTHNYAGGPKSVCLPPIVLQHFRLIIYSPCEYWLVLAWLRTLYFCCPFFSEPLITQIHLVLVSLIKELHNTLGDPNHELANH